MKRRETIDKLLHTNITCHTSLDELERLNELFTYLIDKIEDKDVHDKLVRKHQEVISAIIIRYQLVFGDEDIEDN